MLRWNTRGPIGSIFYSNETATEIVRRKTDGPTLRFRRFRFGTDFLSLGRPSCRSTNPSNNYTIKSLRSFYGPNGPSFNSNALSTTFSRHTTYMVAGGAIGIHDARCSAKNPRGLSLFFKTFPSPLPGTPPRTTDGRARATPRNPASYGTFTYNERFSGEKRKLRAVVFSNTRLESKSGT